MMKQAGWVGAIVLFALSAGCAAGASSDGDETAGAVESTAQLTRLATATVDDVLKMHDASVAKAIAECTKAHPEVTSISAQTTYEFTKTDPYNPPFDYLSFGIDLGDMLRGSQASIPVSELGKALHDWAAALIAPTTGTDGVIDQAKFYGLQSYGGLYQAYEKSTEENALTRAKAPTGIDIRALREQWNEVRSGTTLDSRFLLPVAVTGEPSLADVRKAYAGRVDFISWGNDAVRDFAAAGEGPNGDPAFKPIADALLGRGVTKRWYFAGANSAWSTNILVVLDDKNQLWGFQMGYSK
jgi:hypothetical protein